MDDPVGYTARDLLIRGVRVRCFERGTGPALLLVHGLLVNHHEFDLVAGKLAEHYRVIAPDLPGFGESEKPREFDYSREGYAELLTGLLAGLDVARARVVGHSMGGGVALTLAADHPECVERLAVINAMAFPFNLPLKGRLPTFPIIGPFIFKRLYNRLLFHDYFRNNVFAKGFAYDRASVDAYYRAFDPPDAREAAYRVLMSTLDFAALGPRLAKIRTPTLVLWGELDPMFPIELGARLAREVSGAQLESLPGCGHSPVEENPARTVELLARHFASEAR